MKCAAHNNEATGVCSWCSRAVCATCAKPTASGRFVCSDDCATSLTRESKAMELILQKSLQNTRANAFYYYLCAGLCAAGAGAAWRYLPSPFLIWFCAGASAVFMVMGSWYAWLAQKGRE